MNPFRFYRSLSIQPPPPPSAVRRFLHLYTAGLQVYIYIYIHTLQCPAQYCTLAGKPNAIPGATHGTNYFTSWWNLFVDPFADYTAFRKLKSRSTHVAARAYTRTYPSQTRFITLYSILLLFFFLHNLLLITFFFFFAPLSDRRPRIAAFPRRRERRKIWNIFAYTREKQQLQGVVTGIISFEICPKYNDNDGFEHLRFCFCLLFFFFIR